MWSNFYANIKSIKKNQQQCPNPNQNYLKAKTLFTKQHLI